MEFGICMGPEGADDARDAGFTFIDGGVGGVLVPDAVESAFEDAWAVRSAAALPTLNLNCLLPGGMFVAGPDADLSRAVDYCSVAFARAGRVGIQTICFGSGKGRACPDGWPLARAMEQIEAFVTRLIPAIEASGVKLVVENLQTAETNTLNRVADIDALVSRVGSASVGLLVDGFHWARNADAAASVTTACPRIFHTHIATTTNRLAPGEESCDFAPFAASLAAGGYSGRMAIEGGLPDTSPAGFKRMHETLARAFNAEDRQSGAVPRG